MLSSKQLKLSLGLTASLILSHGIASHASGLPKSAAIYYASPEVINITPYFDYYSSDRNNSTYSINTINQVTGVVVEYGINSILSVGGIIAYGEENSSQSTILKSNQISTSSKGMLDPELYLGTHYSFEKFRVYGNLVGHASLENHKTATAFDNGNMANGGSSAELELAADAPLGPVTAGLLVAKSVWNDNRQVYDNATYSKYQLSGGEFEKYKAFFELNSLNSIKPGIVISYRKTNPSMRILEFTNQKVNYDYGQNDTISELYGRIRIDSALIFVGSITQIDTLKNPSQLNQDAFKTYGLNLGLTLKY